jgi:hypothetical protein
LRSNNRMEYAVRSVGRSCGHAHWIGVRSRIAQFAEDHELPGLSGRAAESVLQLVQIFFVSTVALVPGQSTTMVGVEFLTVGVVFWAARGRFSLTGPKPLGQRLRKQSSCSFPRSESPSLDCRPGRSPRWMKSWSRRSQRARALL